MMLSKFLAMFVSIFTIGEAVTIGLLVIVIILIRRATSCGTS